MIRYDEKGTDGVRPKHLDSQTDHATNPSMPELRHDGFKVLDANQFAQDTKDKLRDQTEESVEQQSCEPRHNTERPQGVNQESRAFFAGYGHLGGVSPTKTSQDTRV